MARKNLEWHMSKVEFPIVYAILKGSNTKKAIMEKTKLTHQFMIVGIKKLLKTNVIHEVEGIYSLNMEIIKADADKCEAKGFLLLQFAKDLKALAI